MITVLRATWALYMGHLITFTRSRTAAYWTFSFPILYLLIFGIVFGRGRAAEINLLMPGFFTITLISGSLFGVSQRMVAERETGVLRRHRLTPVHALSVVLAHGAMAFTTLAASLLIQAVIARIVFDFHAAGSIGALALVFVLGGLALIPFGLVVGSVARDSKVAPAMTNFLFFPLMFLSGAAFPFPYMPEWLQRVARLIPTTYLVEALQGVIVRGTSAFEIGAPVIMLLLTAIIGVSVNGLLFRWESNEPVRYRRLLIAVLALALVYGVAYEIAPVLHIATKFAG